MFLLSWLRPWEEVKKLEDLLFEAETFLKNLASNFVSISFQEINRLHRSLGSWAGSSYWIFSLLIKNTTIGNLLQIKTFVLMFVSALPKETYLPFQLERINHTWENCHKRPKSGWWPKSWKSLPLPQNRIMPPLISLWAYPAHKN